MELKEILKRIDAVPVTEETAVEQLKHVEDGEPYQVWKLETGTSAYILKEAKEYEAEIYGAILAGLDTDCVPAILQTLPDGDRTYLLMEYVQGEDLCRCDRARLTLALDALISLQRPTWESGSLAALGYSFEESLRSRETRGRYLLEPLLEEAYAKFMRMYRAVPRALCHDDLLPFNVIASEDRAVLIDWEYGGILPYPTSFARLIAHAESSENALFFMAPEDRDFAVDYYYDELLRDKGISREAWHYALECALFYEYCEWVFVGNRYGATDSGYYKKYLPAARRQADKLLSMGGIN